MNDARAAPALTMRDPAPSMRLLLALAATYALYAVLLNSVGTVILQSIVSFGVSKAEGSGLEACKDLTIALASFALASSLPRIGYRRALIASHLLLAIACALMPLLRAFWMTAVSFAVTGATFGLAKVAVYGAIGLAAPAPRRHASTTAFVEGVFMVGVLGGYWLFSAFMGPGQGLGWLRVYWVLAAASLLLAGLWAVTPLDERPLAGEKRLTASVEFAAMLRLLRHPLVLVFLACAFLYVLIEQGLGSWMPTFDHEVLHLSPRLSVQVTSVYAMALGAGRLAASGLLRRVSRYGAMIACVAVMAPVVMFALVATARAGGGSDVDSWAQAPLSVLILPLIGILMAPIYPTMVSIVLNALPVERQAGMTGLIVVFSALGGTLGSLITGRLFAAFGGRIAVAGVLAPIALLLFGLLALRRIDGAAGVGAEAAVAVG